MNISDIVRYLQPTEYKIKESIVTSVEIDSRLCIKGSLFVALTSGKSDGHDYIESAINNGATHLLVSNKTFFQKYKAKTNIILVKDTLTSLQRMATERRKELTIPIICITGSNGKTSTKDTLSSVLTEKYNVYKTPKNYNNHIGLPLSILQITEKHEIAVLELGMNHFSEMDLLGNIAKPTIGIIINIGEAHIENLGSKEGIARAKGELLPHINKDGLTVLNEDDEFYSTLQNMSVTTTMPYSIKDIRIQNDEKGCYFWFEGIEYYIPLHGKHNVSNAICAIKVADFLGFAKKEIKNGLKKTQITNMRFEKIILDNKIVINDAYNASPSSTVASVQTFMDLYKEKKKMIVLGDMFELGDRSNEYHKQVGRFLNQYKSELVELVTIGELSKEIYNEYQGLKTHFCEKVDAKKHIESSHNEVLLIKASRGMELETLIQ